MLSLQTQDFHLFHPSSRPMTASFQPIFRVDSFTMGGSQQPDSPTHAGVDAEPETCSRSAEDAAVAQALEMARESPDGSQDPTIRAILDVALGKVWAKVQAQPDSYVMTRDEFAVFNFFQGRFTGDQLAVAARKRYWDNFRA